MEYLTWRVFQCMEIVGVKNYNYFCLMFCV